VKQPTVTTPKQLVRAISVPTPAKATVKPTAKLVSGNGFQYFCMEAASAGVYISLHMTHHFAYLYSDANSKTDVS
jgi:hypothetical protein